MDHLIKTTKVYWIFFPTDAALSQAVVAATKDYYLTQFTQLQ